MTYIAAGQCRGGGPQWIVRCRNQDFIAVIEQCLHGHGNQLGYAVADVNVVDGNVEQAFGLIVMNDGFACGIKAFGVAIALRGRQVADHVNQNFIRCFKAERGRVANIELEDFVAFFFQLQGFFMNRAADVVANVIQLGRFGKFLHDVCSVKLLTMGVNVLFLRVN